MSFRVTQATHAARTAAQQFDGPYPATLKGRLLSVLRHEGRQGFNEYRAIQALRAHPGDISPAQDRVLRTIFRNAYPYNYFDENRAFAEVLRAGPLSGEQASALIRISHEAKRFPRARDYDQAVQQILYGGYAR